VLAQLGAVRWANMVDAVGPFDGDVEQQPQEGHGSKRMAAAKASAAKAGTAAKVAAVKSKQALVAAANSGPAQRTKATGKAALVAGDKKLAEKCPVCCCGYYSKRFLYAATGVFMLALMFLFPRDVEVVDFDTSGVLSNIGFINGFSTRISTNLFNNNFVDVLLLSSDLDAYYNDEKLFSLTFPPGTNYTLPARSTEPVEMLLRPEINFLALPGLLLGVLRECVLSDSEEPTMSLIISGTADVKYLGVGATKDRFIDGIPCPV